MILLNPLTTLESPKIAIHTVLNGEIKQNNLVDKNKYDGLGKRIKKETATEYVVFVYDGLGKLIGEYSADGPPAAPTVNYTATDPLGSPRVLTNKQGEVVSRRDFMPFGEEVAAMAETHRTPGDKYGVGDGVRQKFTGYERDEETGLDFAEARYYYNNHGRFTAVDPLLASGKSADPQTFNRYAYTMNRPLILTDPTGLQAGGQLPEFSFTVYARAFAPYEKFGTYLNIVTGDNRGFSVSESASYRIQATSQVSIGSIGNGAPVMMTYTRASDPATSNTILPGGVPAVFSADSETYVNDSDGTYQPGGFRDGAYPLQYHAYGNDDAIPLSPNIDLFVNLSFDPSNKGGGVVDMKVTGTITGDQFPAAESFIVDKNKNSLMLGTFAPSANSGPVGSLPGEKRLPMINVDLTVRVKDGVFQGVVEGNNLISVEKHNERYTSQPAIKR